MKHFSISAHCLGYNDAAAMLSDALNNCVTHEPFVKLAPHT